MRIVNRQALIQFWQKHRGTESVLKAWLHEVDHACWRTPREVLDHFPNARAIPGPRVIFNIKGDQYRLIVHVNYGTGVFDIRFIDTHAEYDRIDAEKI